jgi:hypothetical protein
MKEELQKKLHEDFPDIFVNKTYLECDDGWFELLNRTCDLIQNHIDYLGEKCPQLVATQIKEKFGGLRFYHHGGDNYTSGVVDMAEMMSYRICEVCGDQGKPGSPQEHGWITTRCSKHTYLGYTSTLKSKKGAVALDFDGVINSYKSNFVAVDVIPDPPVDGALDAIRDYLDFGLTVYIYSTRNEWPEGRQAIHDWLIEHGLEEDRVNDLQIVSGKPIAKIYVDDRAWHFDGKFPSIDEIKYYRPWHGGSSSSQK